MKEGTQVTVWRRHPASAHTRGSVVCEVTDLHRKAWVRNVRYEHDGKVRLEFVRDLDL